MSATETTQSAVCDEAAQRASNIAAEFAELRREHASIAEELASIRADLDDLGVEISEQRTVLDRIAAALLGRADR